jgi:hypothetical protein
MKTKASLGTVFEAILEEFSEGGRPYRREGIDVYYGTISRSQLSANPYSCTDCGTVFKTDLWGTVLCCKRYFSWLKSVINVVLNFPEAK